jgi:hypothetical protein
LPRWGKTVANFMYHQLVTLHFEYSNAPSGQTIVES